MRPRIAFNIQFLLRREQNTSRDLRFSQQCFWKIKFSAT